MPPLWGRGNFLRLGYLVPSGGRKESPGHRDKEHFLGWALVAVSPMPGPLATPCLSLGKEISCPVENERTVICLITKFWSTDCIYHSGIPCSLVYSRLHIQVCESIFCDVHTYCQWRSWSSPSCQSHQIHLVSFTGLSFRLREEMSLVGTHSVARLRRRALSHLLVLGGVCRKPCHYVIPPLMGSLTRPAYSSHFFFFQSSLVSSCVISRVYSCT